MFAHVKNAVFAFGAEIVNFQVNSHLLVAFEDVVDSRPDLRAADHELPLTDALGCDMLDQVGQHDGA